MRVALIGAGLSGITAARTLLASGYEVAVFEKSRGPSGRMSTRRSEAWQADHGAQYFTAKRPDFQAQVHDWCQQGLAAEWHGRIVNQGTRPPIQRFVGTPRMSALPAELSKPLRLHTEFTLTALTPTATPNGCQWQLTSKEHGPHEAPFDAVILSIPSPQLKPFEHHFPATWREVIHGNTYSPCWTVMAGYTEPLTLEFDGRFMDEPSPLSWIARNHSKPGRTGPETWTLHASPAFSTSHLEEDPQEVTDTLLQTFYALGALKPDWVQTHRWRYALATNPRAPSEQALWSPDLRLGLCGDWLSDGRIEGAWRSGLHCARQLLSHSTH